MGMPGMILYIIIVFCSHQQARETHNNGLDKNALVTLIP